MSEIKGTLPPLPKEIDRPLYHASYFGFRPIGPPQITEEDEKILENYRPHPHFHIHDRAAFLRSYLENNFSELPHPLALSYRKPRTSDFSLNLVGLDTPITEAILIRTALSMLEDEGHKDTIVDINCIGDRDSIAAYERELHQFTRKVISNFSSEKRKLLKEDVFNILRFDDEEMEAIRDSIPSTISSLSPSSRNYFKEVLEHIEELGVDFRITPKLVGSKHYCSHTIFAIRSADEEQSEALAIGYRYTRLSRRLGLRKDIELAGATIFKVEKSHKRRAYKRLPKPKFYLIQLGRNAKMKALSLIEFLRVHNISIYHFLEKDKIATQLKLAEELGVSYLLILGQKEALDNTVTVRNVSTRAQETIPRDTLPTFLKQIKL